jgi:hypothetical protein
MPDSSLYIYAPSIHACGAKAANPDMATPSRLRKV